MLDTHGIDLNGDLKPATAQVVGETVVVRPGQRIIANSALLKRVKLDQA